MVSGLPFDDIRALASSLPPADEHAAALSAERQDAMTAVIGGMALEARICEWLARWSGKSPSVQRPLVALFAGTHGSACGSGSSDASGETTLDGVTRLAAGGGAVNQVCAASDIGLKVFDLALQFPVGDIASGDAMDEKGSAATIGFGMEAIAGGVDLLGLASFGRGDAASSIALLHFLLGLEAGELMLISGIAGSDDFTHTVEVAIARHSPAKNDPLELLRRLGGREHSALLGGILAARVDHVPVVLSGMSALAVAMVAHRLQPGSCDHCIIAGGSSMGAAGGLEERICAKTGMLQLLSGHAAPGDGMTAALAISLIRNIAAIHDGFVASA